VANGYREDFLQFVRKVRKQFKDKVIIAGNIATREMSEALILAGADIVKVGIGPGSVCTTRKVAGVGYPQLSAISECADAAHGLGGHVMSDGGCTSPGDVSKAFAAGADFVMLGGMFAGHDESGGEVIEIEGKKYKSFYGMSSAKAMETYFGEVAKHRAPEGKEVRVPYRGPVEVTVQAILGGIRSACSYVGARRIKDLPKCTTFVRVTITTNEIYTNHEKA
jgi:GMP reductase